MTPTLNGKKAAVVGSGPNGLAAAIVLAQAGFKVDVFEAQATIGGASRTLPLTLPGFVHDFGSAVHPMAAASPFFSGLQLESRGLEWLEPPIALAHPLDDGTAVCLHKDITRMDHELGADGVRWRRLYQPFVDHWNVLADEILKPASLFSRHPFLMARFGLASFPSAKVIANTFFTDDRTKALFAGLAAHSFLSLEEPLSAAVAIALGTTAHVVGWPIPRGGSQSITASLLSVLAERNISVQCGRRILDIKELEEYDLKMLDVTPRQFLQMAGPSLQASERSPFEKFRYGSAAYKIDYALSDPIPWTASDCRQAGTVHLGGSLDDIVEAERLVRKGEIAPRPYSLLAQPSLVDASRAPQGKHVAWVYCHVPHGTQADMVSAIEDQIERFAPGFRDCVLHRSVMNPATLESRDENLVGGDINGGVLDLRQFFNRPTSRHYATPIQNVFLCSSSTPPGGGVHGMCGFHAASAALRGSN